MNLVEVVIQTEQQVTDSKDIPVPTHLSEIISALSERWSIRICSYSSTSAPVKNKVKLYYFNHPDQLNSSFLYEHINKHTPASCDRSVALLNFRIHGLCPDSATYFKDLIILDTDTDISIQLISSALTNIDQPKNHTVNKSIIDAFFNLSFVGQSQHYHNLVGKVSRMAKCRAPVLIEGETGTGKELLARALHYLSDEKSYAFVPINCAAIPDDLLESELFGHEKGAFTHAEHKHQGLIDLAEGGTLFLDEVDSLSAKAQTALLRFLQSGEIRAVGSCHIRQANVRLVAASNTPLANRVKQEAFREDLFFRLNVLNLHVPPLRERVDDIEILSQYLLFRFEQQYRQPQRLLHPDLLVWLKRQHWPGNVRELENYLLRRYLLSDASILGIEEDQTSHQESTEISPHGLTDMSFKQAKDSVIDAFSENYIAAMLTRTAGNVTHAARLAGKERRAFGKLMKKYHIEARTFQPS